MGLRELKDHLSEVIPVDREVSAQERRAIIDDLDSLAAEIGRHTGPSNVAETISKNRR